MSKTKRPNATTQRQLVLTRQLYLQGASLVGRQHSGMARLLGVVVLDLAVETCLKAVITSLDASRRPASTFDGVLKQAEAVLTTTRLGGLPMQAEVLHVHSVRNDAQHRARLPLPDEAAEARAHVQDFLTKVLVRVWGLPLAKVSIALLVQAEDVQKHLLEAELALARRQFKRAGREAVFGLTMAIASVRSHVVGPTDPFGRAFVMEEDLKHALEARPGRGGLRLNLASRGRNTYRAFVRMQEVVLLSALGMNLGDYVRFRQLAGEAIYALDGKATVSGGAKRLAETDAEYCVAYAVESVLEMEARMGSLAPFGSSGRWF